MSSGQGVMGGLGTNIPDFSSMTDEQLDQYIVTNYPTYSWLINDPEIGPILRNAARGINSKDPLKAQASSPEAVQSQIENTQWFKTHTTTARAWQELQQTDPGTARQKVLDKATEISAMLSEAGFSLNQDDIYYRATQALELGWSDVTLRQTLLASATAYGKPVGTSGSMATNAEQVKQLAAEYLLAIPDWQASKFAELMWSGQATMDTVRGHFVDQARDQYGQSNPSLSQALDRGVSPLMFIGPQLQAVAQTLEMGPDQINPLDPKWSTLINVDNGKGGMRIATVPEAKAWARQQREFRYTDQANDDADRRVMRLATSLGVRKFS